MVTEEIKCEVCGKTFKTKQALAGHMQGSCSTGQSDTTAVTTRETKAPAKTGSLDAAIEKLQLPSVPSEYNGFSKVYWEGFNKGVNYGATSILVGIRSAQELSSLGISQATPIIKMAQEMRLAEGQAAQDLAAQVNHANMQNNQQILAALNNLNKPEPDMINPLVQVAADTFKPFLSQIMQNVMGSVIGGLPGQQNAVQEVPVTQYQNTPHEKTESMSDAFGEMPDNVTQINDEEDIDV